MSSANLLSTADVAERLDVDESTVRLWCRQDRFEGAQLVGRDWVIPAAALDAFQKPKMGRPPKLKAASPKAAGKRGRPRKGAES